MLTQVVVKLNRACNLRCKYCYYINEHTDRLNSRMQMSTLQTFLDKYYNYCREIGLKGRISFHGGEPLLMGKRYFSKALEHEGFADGTFRAAVQTNGMLLDEEWIDILEARSVGIGISLDGPPQVNDRVRVTRKGNGSYERVLRSIKLMQQRNIHVYVLCVVDPTADGSDVFHHLVELGIRDFDFLPPISSWADRSESIIDLKAVEEFLLDAFLAWLELGDSSVQVRLFCELMWRYMGLRRGYTAIGVEDWSCVGVLETDGEFARSEELAALERYDGIQRYCTGVNVTTCTIEEAISALDISRAFVDCTDLPTSCRKCTMNDVCNGGSLASRFDRNGSFDNPGVHCGALYRLSALIKEVCLASDTLTFEHPGH